MVLTVRKKGGHAIYQAIPAFVNMWNDETFLVEEHGIEVIRKMENYNVYVKPRGIWMDLRYALYEGFLDGKQLRNWHE
jgi:hypothetical protein